MTGTEMFSHIWLLGDRVVCMGCDYVSGEVEFVGPDYPLCADCRRELGYEGAA